MYLKGGHGDGTAFPLSFHPSPMSLMAANNSYRGCYRFLHLATVSQPVPLSVIAGGKCSLEKPPPIFEMPSHIPPWCIPVRILGRSVNSQLRVQDSLKTFSWNLTMSAQEAALQNAYHLGIK